MRRRRRRRRRKRRRRRRRGRRGGRRRRRRRRRRIRKRRRRRQRKKFHNYNHEKFPHLQIKSVCDLLLLYISNKIFNSLFSVPAISTSSVS
jgi:hypothetical protein